MSTRTPSNSTAAKRPPPSNLTAAQHLSEPVSSSKLQTMVLQAHAEEKNPYNEKAKSSVESAGMGLMLVGPGLFVGGASMVVDSVTSKETDVVSVVVNSIGVVVGGLAVLAAPAAVPVGIIWSVGSLARAGYYGIRSLFYRDQAESRQIKDIVASFGLRCTHMMAVMVQLGIDTPDGLQKRFASNAGKRTVYALGAFSTALASRGHDKPVLCLANTRAMSKQNCPSIGHSVFDQVLEIRDLIRRDPGLRIANAEIIPKILVRIPAIVRVLDRGTAAVAAAKQEQEESKGSATQERLAAALCKIAEASREFKFLKHMQIDWNEVRSVTPYLPEVLRALEQREAKAVAAAAAAAAALPVKKPFVDKITGRPLTNAWMADDGFFYDLDTVHDLKGLGLIKDAFRIYAHGGPSEFVQTDDLLIDPIVPNRIVTPVLASDGYFYDLTTVDRLMQERLPGMGAAPITKFYNCKEPFFATGCQTVVSPL